MKGEPFSRSESCRFPFGENFVPVDESPFDRGWESVSFKRRPTAFGQDIVGGNGVGFVRVDHNNVGIIARAQVSPLFYMVELSRSVAHLLDDLFERELASRR